MAGDVVQIELDVDRRRLRRSFDRALTNFIALRLGVVHVDPLHRVRGSKSTSERLERRFHARRDALSPRLLHQSKTHPRFLRERAPKRLRDTPSGTHRCANVSPSTLAVRTARAQTSPTPPRSPSNARTPRPTFAFRPSRPRPTRLAPTHQHLPNRPSERARRPSRTAARRARASPLSPRTRARFVGSPSTPNCAMRRELIDHVIENRTAAVAIASRAVRAHHGEAHSTSPETSREPHPRRPPARRIRRARAMRSSIPARDATRTTERARCMRRRRAR